MDIAKKIIAAGLSSLGVVSIKDLPKGLLHRTIQEIINQQAQWVSSLLSGQVDLIRDLAAYLMEKEKITGNLFREKVKGQQKGKSSQAVML